MNRKAVIYTRVSTDEQREKGFSLQDQKARLIRYCRQKHLEIIAHYQDDHSAKNFKRPEFQRFILNMQEKTIKPDVFLCVRMDRFSRNLEASLDMLSKFKGWNLEFRTLENNYDLSQPENLIPHILNMVLPQVENERRGLNTKRGMRQAMKEGRWTGKAPKGYTFQRKDKKSLLIPNEEANYVQRAFEEYGKGIYAMEEVRKKLAREGYKGVKKMQFTNILRNPVYISKIRIPAWKDEAEEIVDGLHEPLISEELFYQVQAILDGKSSNRGMTTTRKEELPLRGFLTCDKCGGKLTGSASRSRNGTRHYYYHCQKGCKERFRADTANLSLKNYLDEISIPEEVLNLYHAVMKDLFKSDDQERQGSIEKLNKEIKSIQERMENLVDKFTDDLIDQATYNRTKKRYEDKLNDLIGRKAELERQDQNFMRYVRYGFSLLNNLGAYYEQASLPVKQKIIGSIFPENLIYDHENYRTTRPNAVLELFALKTNELVGENKKPIHIIADRSCKAPPLGLEPRTY